MNLSELYLQKYTDNYANFGYKDQEGTYSEAGIEVEHAKMYGEIIGLEAKLEKLAIKNPYLLNQ